MCPRKMEEYRRTARMRLEKQRHLVAGRRERAWEVARRAAHILREEYGAGRVMAFGSLVRDKGFHLHSDVDLAVWGIPEEAYCRAVARVLDIEPSISVDLVEIEESQPYLRRVIAEEGVIL